MGRFLGNRSMQSRKIIMHRFWTSRLVLVINLIEDIQKEKISPKITGVACPPSEPILHDGRVNGGLNLRET